MDRKTFPKQTKTVNAADEKVLKSRARDRFTAVSVRNNNTPGFHHDGGGLYLQVSKSGTKSWVLRYTKDKKVRYMGLGSVLDWSLAEARERARKFRQLLDDDIDPLILRDQERKQRLLAEEEARKQHRTFKECAEEYHKANADDWKNAKHRDQWINTLTSYAFPHFGKLPISQLRRDDIREALLPIWKDKAETASRVLQRIRTVVNYGAAMGYCNGLDSEQWDQLKKSLPKNSRQLEGQHHASCPHQQVGAVLRTVRQGTSSDSVKLAFEYIVLTAARTGEVRFAVWEEVDFENKLWSIPKERMKAGRPHTVPLSDRAITVLEAAKLLQPKPADAAKRLTGMIFPSSTKGVLSDMTFTQIMRRMKVDHTMHGFRASFRTWAAEVAHFDHDLLEFALAHVVGDATVRAYQRSDMVEKRRKLMQNWATYVQSTENADLIQQSQIKGGR